MGDVIKKDFGKEDREFARALGRLLKLAEERDQDILENPRHYIDLASQRIVQYELFLDKLEDALRHPSAMTAPLLSGDPPRPLAIDAVTVDRRDYESLQEVKNLMNNRARFLYGQAASSEK